MNRVQVLRNRRKSTQLKVGEGDESFMITVPLPTPYETQTILYDTMNKSIKEDEFKFGGEILKKSMAWIDFNLPTIDGEKLRLTDLNDTEYDQLKEAVQDIFFRANQKQVKQAGKRSPSTKVPKHGTIPV